MKNRIIELKKLIKDKDYESVKNKAQSVLIEIKENINLFGLNYWVKLNLKNLENYKNNQLKRLVNELDNLSVNLWVIKRVDRLSRLDDLDKIKLCIADYNNDIQQTNKYASSLWNRLLICLILDNQYDLKDICFNIILKIITNKREYLYYKNPDNLEFLRP